MSILVTPMLLFFVVATNSPTKTNDIGLLIPPPFTNTIKLSVTNKPHIPVTNIVPVVQNSNWSRCSTFFVQQSFDLKSWTNTRINYSWQDSMQKGRPVWLFPTNTPTYYRAVGQ